MLYLLDANTLIAADKNHYPRDRIPQFWKWIVKEGTDGCAKMPFAIHNEIAKGSDSLAKWIKEREVREALMLEEEVDGKIFNEVLEAYGDDLDETEISAIGGDPFLIAHALMEGERCVVTREVSKPTLKRGNRRIPDVCGDLGVRWMNDFGFYEKRDFRIPL